METFLDLFPSIHDTFGLKEALGKLAQCERLIKTNGPTTILTNSNVIYSLLQHKNELKDETINEVLLILHKGLDMLEKELKKLLVEKFGDDKRVEYLNTLKIFTYLTVEFSNFLERKTSKDAQNVDLLSTGGNKKNAAKRKKATHDIEEDASNFNWLDSKCKILDSIAKILLLNIQKLWNPPIAEEQFVEIITNMCYKMIENAQNTKTKTVKDHLIHILAQMIKKFNHSYGACVMIIQTLAHYEHLNITYAELIEQCVVELGYEAILSDLLRELRHFMNSNELKVTTSGKENQNIKFYSQFLIELSERLPKHLVNYLSLLIDFLDEESYLMRNAILMIMGEIVVKVLDQASTNGDLAKKQMRNELLDTLCEHIHDSNAITRSKSLQIWRKICDENCMPLHYQNEIMKRCVGRMEDVASTVRKSAFQLLCDLIKKNPYGIQSIQVKLDEIDRDYHKEKAILDEMEAQLASSQESGGEGGGAVVASQEDGSNPELERLTVQKTKVNFLSDTIGFLRQIESAIPKLTQLLFSKTQTDVIEVISFFVTCYEHGLSDMLMGIRKMLSLILFAEATIKEAVIEAYKRLYIKGKNALNTAMQLINLTFNVTVCELDALEHLMHAFLDSGELDNTVIQILWEIFTQKSSTNVITREQSTGALILLSMIIKKVPSKGKANIDVLIEHGLDDKDLYKASQACLALSNIVAKSSTKKIDLNEPFKLPVGHRLFQRIIELIITTFNTAEAKEWTSMVDSALCCIYKLADNPLVISENILRQMYKNTFPENSDIPMDGGAEAVSTINTLQLTRFMSALGAISIRLLTFCNTSIVCELKRRKELKENNDALKKSGKGSKSKNTANTSRRKSRSRKSMVNSSSQEVDLQEEMGLQGAEAEDSEQMFVEHLLETKVSLNSFISKLVPLILAILKEPRRYADERLQMASSMALARIMCLSRKLCMDNLQMLFTVLEKSQSELVRSQLILAIGDLVYRFPNALEPWTSHLYMPLRDKSVKIKINTIRVLSHLILKEMIKTRGQIYEIALCTIDDDVKISTLAKYFFSELSKRNNGLVIYNLMPDMISQLSEYSKNEEMLNEESFRSIVSYLFSFIKKDKQCETLIEKLAHGFRAANVERKCRDLAFCLSKININDNGIKKLFETYKWFEDKLSIPEVAELFRLILKNTKKILTLRADTRKLVEEFEKKIEESLSKGVNDENGENVEPGSTQQQVMKVTQKGAAKKTGASGGGGKKTAKNRKASSSSDEDSDGGENDDGEEIATTQVRRAAPGGGRNTAASTQATRSSTRNEKRPPAKRVISSDSDSDSD